MWHTGGEWAFSVKNDTGVPATLYTEVEGCEVDIATFEEWGGEYAEEQLANAQLMIAAPELLMALKQAISMLDSDISWLPEDYPARSIVARAEAVIKFHKAIAKAEEKN